MGIVKQQGIKESIVAYVGVIIGAISTLIIQPYFLTPAEIGLIKMLIALATLMYPLTLMGMSNVAIRYFPEFNNQDEQHHGLISFVLLVPIVGFIITAIIFLLLQTQITQWYMEHKDNHYIVSYLPYALPLTFFMAYMIVLNAISRSLLKIVVPSIFQNIIIRLGTIVGIIMYFFQILSLTQLIIMIILMYAIASVGILVYIYRQGHLFIKPDRRFFKKPQLKKISNYALFVLFIGISTTIVTQIDILMVGALKGESRAGVYTIALFIGTVIEIPYRSLTSITSPLIAQAFEKRDYSHINYLYKNVSTNLFIIGSLLLIGIWVNIENLYELMPNGSVYADGKYVVLFIGLMKLFNMVSSVNSEIITYSSFYRFTLYAIFALAIMTVATNLYFIPRFDIVGAAIASFLAMVFFNISKMIFIWIKMRIHPFSSATIKVLVLSLLVYGCNYLIPSLSHPLLDIILRSAIIGGLYVGLLVGTKISPEINDLLVKGWKKATGKEPNI